MIEKLKWDADFFGYSIAKLEVNSIEEFNKINNSEELKKYKLVYIYSDNYINTFKSILVDERTSFIKTIKNNSLFFDNNIKEYNFKIHSYNELLNLSYLSGSLSRFNLDANFISNEYNRLYKKWLDKSIDDQKTKVLIKIIENKIAGFITLEEEDTYFNIGLLAVNENYKGNGIGSCLINYCENFAIKQNKKIIRVTTQGKNIPAIKFYKKNDFQIEKIKYIYHYWNL